MPIAIILVGPSGAGKDTLARRLVDRHPELTFSVSCTTRPPRANERDGVDYCFLTREAFEKTVSEGGFLEWTENLGNLYGTPVAPVKASIAAGRDVLFVVDAQGARSLRAGFAAHDIPSRMVFVAPPSMDALILRMRRCGESEESIGRRMAAVEAEMAARDDYDAVIVNDDLDKAVETLEQSYLAAR